MSAIDINNQKQIRSPFSVFCGLSGRQKSDLTFEISGAKLADSNIDTSLDSENWPRIELADLQGDGFPADGSCSFFRDEPATEDGKVGIRGNIGQPVTVTATSATEVPALTISLKNAGRVAANGVEYNPSAVVVIPVNGQSCTFTVEPTSEDARVEINDIVPGIVISFDNDSIISVEMMLRSDLSITESNWQVSEIEIKAYWADDITEAIANVGDDTPIWYYAGIDGDFSEVRNFYLSEAVTSEDNILTIRGEDASSRLEDKVNPSEVINSTANTGRRVIYNRMAKYITDAGIALRYKESAPADGTASKPTAYSLIQSNANSRVMAQDIMAYGHAGSFWPTFVDAGIPKLTWSKPSSKWTIRERDCGTVARTTDRNLSVLKTDDENGLQSTVTRSSTVKTLQTKNVTAGQAVNFNPEGYYWYLTVSNATIVTKNAEKLTYKAKKKTTSKKVKKTVKGKKKTVTVYSNQCVVKGKAATVKVQNKKITHSGMRPGATKTISPVCHGKAYNGTTLIYPNYPGIFSRSNLGGSFLWKGDPRMQPRDVFDFVRLDGSVETCTIEQIQLKHEEGGTTATISYRVGVV